MWALVYLAVPLALGWGLGTRTRSPARAVAIGGGLLVAAWYVLAFVGVPGGFDRLVLEPLRALTGAASWLGAPRAIPWTVPGPYIDLSWPAEACTLLLVLGVAVGSWGRDRLRWASFRPDLRWLVALLVAELLAVDPTSLGTGLTPLVVGASSTLRGIVLLAGISAALRATPAPLGLLVLLLLTPVRHGLLLLGLARTLLDRAPPRVLLPALVLVLPGVAHAGGLDPIRSVWWSLWPTLVLPVLLLPVARVARQLPVAARSWRILAGMLGVSILWRLTAQTGSLRETYHGRDLDLHNTLSFAHPLFDLLQSAGLSVPPDAVYFGSNAALGVFGIVAVFVVTRVFARRDDLALLASGLVAFLPVHARFSSSEALTVSADIVGALLMLCLYRWLERRDRLLLACVFPLSALLMSMREEGLYLCGVAWLLPVVHRGLEGHWPRADRLLLGLGLILLAAPLPERTLFGHSGAVNSLFYAPARLLNRLLSPADSTWLRLDLMPLPFALAWVVGLMAGAPRGLRAFHRTALLTLGLLCLPYTMVSNGVRPYGSARYDLAYLLPVAWIAALGWLHLRARFGWGWRPLVGVLAINLVVLMPALDGTQYDQPAEDRFLRDLAADPVLDDAELLLTPREFVPHNDDRLHGDYRHPGSQVLRSWLRWRRGRSVSVERPPAGGELEGAYYYRGLYCVRAPEVCAAAERGLSLEPVRERVIPSTPYLRVPPVIHALPPSYEGGIPLTLFRVRAIEP